MDPFRSTFCQASREAAGSKLGSFSRSARNDKASVFRHGVQASEA